MHKKAPPPVKETGLRLADESSYEGSTQTYGIALAALDKLIIWASTPHLGVDRLRSAPRAEARNDDASCETAKSATEAAKVATTTAATVMSSLFLKRSKVSRPSGQWRNDDYDVIFKGAVVGRLFLSAAAPQDRQWMWIQHRTPAHGYEPTRETAMAAFAKSWRR
jgi:hypothetical protein